MREIGAGSAMLLLALAVQVRSVQEWDFRMLYSVREQFSSQNLALLRIVNTVFGPITVFGVAIALALIGHRAFGRGKGARIGLSLAISGLVGVVVREVIRRHWPDLVGSDPSNHFFIWSFPSGQAGLSAAVGTVLVLLFRDSSVRGFAMVCAVIYNLLAAIPLLALGFNYPTDIVGGWSFGWLSTTIVWAAIGQTSAVRNRAVPIH